MTTHKSIFDDVIMAIVMVACVAIAGTIWRLATRKKKAQHDSNNFISPQEIKFYEAAADEVRNKNIVRGVMAKAISESDGDEEITNAKYQRLRASQMMYEKCQEIANAEVENNNIKRDLMAKLLKETYGNITKANARYVQVRATELINEGTKE